MDKFRRIIGILLIIIGVVIIGDVAYKKIITLNKQKEIVKLFENGFSEGTSTEGATESSESVNLDECVIRSSRGRKSRQIERCPLICRLPRILILQWP